MTNWQRPLRLIVALAAVAFLVVVVLAFKRRSPIAPGTPAARTDPAAVAESTSGRVARFRLSREDVRVVYEKQLTYADGSTRLMGVTIVTEERGGNRRFTVTGKEGRVGQNDSTITLEGDVRLASSDDLTVRTERATYAERDGLVRAEGPVEFSRRATVGTAVGMTYDQGRNVLSLLDRVTARVAPSEDGSSGTQVTSGTAEFARGEQALRFGGGAKLQREGRIVEAATAIATLRADDRRIETMSLRGGSSVTVGKAGAGGLQALTGRDMDLTFAADGETLEHALIGGEAAVQLAGEGGKAGARIAADALDIGLAPDGATPVALMARQAVQLTLPGESGMPARTIRSAAMEGTGEPSAGLTRAQFTGGVDYRERGADVDRAATAATLDLALAPGMSTIQEARFGRSVRFIDGKTTALAAVARYDLERGTLELTGSEPGASAPRVVNDRIAVDATRIDLTLAGPMLKATGAVRSALQPAAARTAGTRTEARLPVMFRQDEPISVTAGALDYDGARSKAAYTGDAQLWQGERSIKGASIVIDDKSGDLTASGSVATVTVLDEVSKDQKRTRVRSVATANEFTYEEASRRATYTGDAHMSAPDRDLTAARIELFLKPSGDELERAEAYDGVTLRDPNRRITGTRLSHTTADDRYVVAGQPVRILDACGGETTGRTLTYLKATGTLVVDGNQQARTETRGRGQCP